MTRLSTFSAFCKFPVARNFETNVILVLKLLNGIVYVFLRTLRYNLQLV